MDEPPTTLPDFVVDGIKILSIGLNPSLNSVRDGYPFATRQNRFWSALNRSDLVATEYPPGIPSMHRLMREAHIGFTDVVKRPTAGASDLRVGDYKFWAPILRTKIERLKPVVLWVHGQVAYKNLMRHGFNIRIKGSAWGLQPVSATPWSIFVTPNPSPANACYSLATIIASYDALAGYVGES